MSAENQMKVQGSTAEIITPHGGYRRLKSYQTTEIIYDGTVVFINRFVSKFSRTRDQMVQAARSGKQNIAEGSMAAGTSNKTEIRLTNVARSSLEELLQDYEDHIRQNGLLLWDKDHANAKKIRKLTYSTNRSYLTYKYYIEEACAEVAANTLICLFHQANYLLDCQLRKLEQMFLDKGGFTERLYNSRRNSRGY